MTTNQITAAIRLLRPRQWAKNLLIFAGLFFSQSFFQRDCLLLSLVGFVVLCAVSSTIYILNDIIDCPSDQLHPTKRTRPIASGAISTKLAAAIAAALLTFTALCLILFFNAPFQLLILGYFALMVCYVFWLKHIVILDIMTVAFGFVIRAVAGVVVLQTPDRHVPLTPWFVAAVFFLSLFIVVCKRRHEVFYMEAEDAHRHRKVLQEYSVPLLDQFVGISTTATIMSYALYCVLGGGGSTNILHPEWMIWTLPFVVFGIFRYLYLVYHKTEGGAPETVLFEDWGIITCVVLWAVAIFVCMVL